MLPVVRIPVEVHYGKNEYPVRFYAVEDTVGEAIGEATADVSFKDGPSSRETENVLNGRVDLDSKIITEIIFTCLIVINGFEELSLRFWVKIENHPPKRSLTFSNT